MLPKDLLSIVTEYYVSMYMYEIKQRLHQELRMMHVVQHLKAFHSSCIIDGVFCHKFCLSVLKYMNLNNIY